MDTPDIAVAAEVVDETPEAAPEPRKPDVKAATGILQRAVKSAAGRSREGGELWVFAIRDEVAELLAGSPFDPDSYLQNAYREIAKSSMLQTAVREAGPTVLGAVMLGATLQLPIGGPLGQFYITPRSEKYKDGEGVERWRTVAVPMIGYRGFFELGYRSGNVSHYDYVIVRQKDVWSGVKANSERGKFYDYEQFAEGEYDELDDDEKTKRALRGVVAIAKLTNGQTAWQYLSKTAIEARRPRKIEHTPWSGPHAEAMYVKTPHRELAKYLQLSIQSAKAVEADETISVWNQLTESLDTLAPEQNAITVGDQDGNGADPGEAGSDQDGSSSASESPPEGSKPAGRRTAKSSPKGDPRDDSIERLPDDADYEPWLSRLAAAQAAK